MLKSTILSFSALAVVSAIDGQTKSSIGNRLAAESHKVRLNSLNFVNATSDEDAAATAHTMDCLKRGCGITFREPTCEERLEQHAGDLSEGGAHMLQNWNPENHYVKLIHVQEPNIGDAEKEVQQSLHLRLYNMADNSEVQQLDGASTYDAPSFLENALAGCVSYPIRISLGESSTVTLTGSSDRHFNVAIMPDFIQDVSQPDLAHYFLSPPDGLIRMYHAVHDAKQPRMDFQQNVGSAFELTVSDTHESSTVEPVTTNFNAAQYHKAITVLVAKSLSSDADLPVDIHLTAHVGHKAIQAFQDGSSMLDAKIDEPNLARIHLNLNIEKNDGDFSMTSLVSSTILDDTSDMTQQHLDDVLTTRWTEMLHKKPVSLGFKGVTDQIHAWTTNLGMAFNDAEEQSTEHAYVTAMRISLPSHFEGAPLDHSVFLGRCAGVFAGPDDVCFQPPADAPSHFQQYRNLPIVRRESQSDAGSHSFTVGGFADQFSKSMSNPGSGDIAVPINNQDLLHFDPSNEVLCCGASGKGTGWGDGQRPCCIWINTCPGVYFNQEMGPCLCTDSSHANGAGNEIENVCNYSSDGQSNYTYACSHATTDIELVAAYDKYECTFAMSSAPPVTALRSVVPFLFIPLLFR